MKRFIQIGILAVFVTFGCAKKDQESYLWILALLGSQPQGITSNTPENPNPDPGIDLPTKIHITLLPASSTQNLCPIFGGAFFQYKRGMEESCSVNDWEPSCVAFVYNPDGSIKTLDARSFVGINFNEDLELPSNFNRSSNVSNLICFKQNLPSDNDHVEMYSFQLQAIKNKSIICETTWNENQCIDTFPILGRAEFVFPKEFPILSSDGEGHAGSQTLLLKFVTEESLYTTCTYFGNEHRKIVGFTENAYIAGNTDQGNELGSCKQCETNYCESVDPNSGLPITTSPIHQFSIPVGSSITIQKEITMIVVKGQGPGKHSVRWNLQGFNQWIVANQTPVLFSDTKVLFLFMLPILLTMMVLVIRLWKKRNRTK